MLTGKNRIYYNAYNKYCVIGRPKTSVNWANILKVSINIVLLWLGGKNSWQSLQFSTHVAIVYIFLSLRVIVGWYFVRRILIGRCHPLLHRIENNTVRTRNSDLICQGCRGEDRNPWLAKMCLQRLCQIFSFRGLEILKSSTCPRASNLKKLLDSDNVSYCNICRNH
jgi:hypothetical protein